MIPLRWRVLGTEAEEAARQVNTYRLSGGPDFVRWDYPDGFTYTLDLRGAQPWERCRAIDANGGEVIIFQPGWPANDTFPAQDGVLALSLRGANSMATTLLQGSNDGGERRNYCFASDTGNDSYLGGPAFVLSASGVQSCPLIDGTYYVMTVRVGS